MGRVSLVQREAGQGARARSTNSRTASTWAPLVGRRACVRSGSASDGTRQVVSPLMRSGSRLVARMRRCGQAVSRSCASCATGLDRCSQLSSSSRRRRVSAVRPGYRSAACPAPRECRAPRDRRGTRSGSETRPARPARRRPGTGGQRSATQREAGLAAAPGPVRVSRRVPWSKRLTRPSRAPGR